DTFYLLAHMIDGSRLAQQFELETGPAAQLFVLAPQTCRFHGPIHDQKKPICLERLFDEVIGAKLDRLDGSLDISVPADHQHGKTRMLPFDEPKRLQAVEGAVVQPYVEDDQGRTASSDCLLRALAV